MSNRGIAIALYANAAAIAALLLYLVWGGSPMSSVALAQSRPALPISDLPAASSGMTLVPVQMTNGTWGCYLLDPQAQVLCIYQYVPGDRLLRLQAARSIAYDIKLKAFNTSPLPAEVAELLSKEAAGKPAQPDPPLVEPGK